LDAKAMQFEQATVVSPIAASVVQELEMVSPSSESSDLAPMIVSQTQGNLGQEACDRDLKKINVQGKL